MDNKRSSSQVSATQPDDQQTISAQKTAVAGPSAEIAGTEAKKAYGTAKTENLRDSGLWRILLPGFIIVASLLLLIIPFLILINLLITSLAANSPTAQLTWLWITMIILEVAVAAVIIWGLAKAFLRQLGYAQ